MNRFSYNINYFFIFLCLLSFAGNAQHSDCETMLKLTDTIYEAINIKEYGNIKEFSNNNLYDSLNFEEEKNSIWYLITAPTSGKFAFDIITNDSDNDWDFLLYEYNENFCEEIAQHKIKPIRSNLSRSAKTGITSGFMHAFVGAGINSNYSKAMEVVVGNQYVLVVNNMKKQGGSHTLKLHFEKPKIPTIITEKPTENTLSFNLLLKNSQTKQPIVGNILINKLLAQSIQKKQLSTYQINVPQRNYKVKINANAKGYLLQTTEIKVDASRKEIEVELLLQPIQKGQKINLKNIQFQGNIAKFLPQATPDLAALLEFMQLNENVKIEIEGHVNGPGQRNSKEYQQLSDDRAKAVKDYLIENGIDENRIESIGYGNTKMLFTNPQSESQMSENRRVEIKIL